MLASSGDKNRSPRRTCADLLISSEANFQLVASTK
jgi:hypothetical protein